MIWVAIGLLAVFALAPLIVALDRHVGARGARDLALTLHRTQLSELDRDLAEGRILPAEHKTAMLEVQRRLLAVADKGEAGATAGARWPVLAVAALVPAAALGLYLIGGKPSMPSVTPGSAPAEEALLLQLEQKIATLDPASEKGWDGYVLLGNIQEQRGDDRAAVAAWRVALQGRFEPVLAIRIAQGSERVDGKLSPDSEALLRRALAEGPKDAPWREAVEEHLKTATP